MNKLEGEQKEISLHWWNFGKKTLDFRGSYKDYLAKKDIKIKEITHKFQKDVKGFRFTIPLSSSVATLDSFGNDYVEDCTRAILILLTLLGDKHLFVDGYGREYQINWR